MVSWLFLFRILGFWKNKLLDKYSLKISIFYQPVNCIEEEGGLAIAAAEDSQAESHYLEFGNSW
jgi:hypothetical protein